MKEKRRRWDNVGAAFTSLLPCSRRVFLSLSYSGRKRGTATSTWPCARTLTGRIRIASFLSSSLAPPRHGYISNSGPVAGSSHKSGGASTSRNTTRHRMQLWYAYLNGLLSRIAFASYSFAVVLNSHIQQTFLAVLSSLISTMRLINPSKSYHKGYACEYSWKLTEITN